MKIIFYNNISQRVASTPTPPVRPQPHLFKNWVEEPDKALVKAFYESRGSPSAACDEKLITIIKQAGKIEDSPRMTVKILEAWRDLPRRIQAVLNNEDVDRNDRYKVIREYVKKDPAFFQPFVRTQHEADDPNWKEKLVLPKVRPSAYILVGFTHPH